MKPRAFEGQVVNLADGSNLAEPSAKRPVIGSSDHPGFALKERISATVRAVRAQKQLQLQQAADRAAAERREMQQRARDALLSLLSDDVLNSIIGKHASLDELQVGTIKVTKNGVEIIRGDSTRAAHMLGEKLDIRFSGAVLQSGQQLQSSEFQSRVQELQVQGIEIEGVYDASGQSILITFDYGKAVS